MNEDSPPHGMSGSGMHYSEEEWDRYTRDLEKSVSSLPQVVMEICMQTETCVHTLESRVDALHATMQKSASMCAEKGPCVQQIQQECETIRTGFHDLTARIAFSFGQVNDALTQIGSEARTLREHEQPISGNAESQPRPNG